MARKLKRPAYGGRHEEFGRVGRNRLMNRFFKSHFWYVFEHRNILYDRNFPMTEERKRITGDLTGYVSSDIDEFLNEFHAHSWRAWEEHPRSQEGLVPGKDLINEIESFAFLKKNEIARFGKLSVRYQVIKRFREDSRLSRRS